MPLERIAIKLRRRDPHEALDLGLAMLQQWRWPVYRAWFASFVPAALFVLAATWRWPTFGLLLVWWLKPLFDRILLKVYAEAIFGEAPTVREIWRSLPGLLKRPGLLASLSWRRFNSTRAFDLPVWQLEGIRGKAARARLRVLGKKAANHASWFTILCAHFVLIFEIGFMQLVGLLLPIDSVFDLSALTPFSLNTPDWTFRLMTLAWLTAESLVEPFYVAAGFSLYLNRRSELEGWDIELSFRRLSENHAQPPESSPRPPHFSRVRGIPVVLFAIGLGLGVIFAPPSCAWAAESTAQNAAIPAKSARQRPEGRVSEAAQQILADPVFGREVEEFIWQPRHRKSDENTDQETSRGLEALGRFVEWLARLLRGLLYGLVPLALAVFLVFLYRHRGRFPFRTQAPKPPPETLFGLDLRPESLPGDISRAALAEIAQKRVTEALSLLYRGALVELIRREQLEFCAGDTEDDCRRRAEGRIDAASAAYFAHLLDAWKSAAYAAAPPSAATANALCQRWTEHFGPAGSAS